MSSPIYARHTDNILTDAVITSTVAPSSTYALTTLAAMDPAQRVLWGVPTVTITFTLGSPAAGAILVIPMHNLVGAVLTLTNGAGYSHAITPLVVQADGYPPTLVVDLEAYAGTLMSTVWNLVIVGNPTNVVLGGAVAIYGPKRTFEPISANSEGSFVGELAEEYEPREEEATNEYGSRYVQEYDWTERGLEWSVIGPNTGIVLARDWFLANHGHARPSLLWPYPDEPSLGLYGPMFGTWQKRLRIEVVKDDTSRLTARFDEWPKGQVIP